ncbi:hypothetical protein FNV43_RR15937 [Rhamnella rubrinervis]|uniref:RNase H type-1 domain-containing protein n=1 Tax=Rhamnella rubrinervis TaxID=2594499 RepID=A0A8K0E8C8_9ROSA|nr:hypothetical protein FNV43_RR15937 [Rhamnella rubrinervis]
MSGYTIDRENSKLCSDGCDAVRQILERIEGKKMESSDAVSRRRVVWKHYAISSLKVEAQMQREEIEAISRGKPEEYEARHSEIARRLHKAKLMRAKRMITFWEGLEQTINHFEDPWIIFGDLNEVTSEYEKWGGMSIWKKTLYLKEFMQQTGGLDLGFHGCKYTWQNNNEGAAFIRERLDRAVASGEWIQNNPNASVQHLAMEESDHTPLLIRTDIQDLKARRPFRFFKAWTTDPSCLQVVQQAWLERGSPGMACHKLGRSLFATTRALRRWNRCHFGYANLRIQSLEEELEIIQSKDGDNRSDYSKVKEELKVHRDRWESILRQKSRELWLREGDQNTKFFHASLVVRKRQNRILTIKTEKGWISNIKDIERYFLNQFQNLFESTYPHIPEDLDNLGEHLVLDEDNENLMKVPSEEEIKASIWDRTDEVTAPRILWHFLSQIQDKGIWEIEEKVQVGLIAGKTSSSLKPKSNSIKSIQALPSYTLSTFKVPLAVCNDLDSPLKGFGGDGENVWSEVALRELCEPSSMEAILKIDWPWILRINYCGLTLERKKGIYGRGFGIALHERLKTLALNTAGNISEKAIEKWKPPPFNWLKEAANSPLQAESKALAWALKTAAARSWRYIIWSSDAQTLVEEINSDEDPGNWDTRMSRMSDEEFYRELLSAVEKMEDESAMKSAAKLVDILKTESEQIVNLLSTIDIQGKKLQELKDKESVRAGLENLELVPPKESKRKQMESSESVNLRRIKMAKAYRSLRKAETERIRRLSDEELYRELQSAVEKMGDEGLLKPAAKMVDILKLQNEKILSLQSTIESQGEKLKELKSKEIDGAGLENMELELEQSEAD